MLIVTRQSSQSVVVGTFDGFERVLKVTVLDVRGSKVRLAFEILSDDSLSNAEVWEQLPEEAELARTADVTHSS